MLTIQVRRQLDQLRRLDRGLFATAMAAIQVAPDLAGDISALGLKAVIAHCRAAGPGSPVRTFIIAPGDGGISDQDLAAPLPAETRRLIEQEMRRRPEVEDAQCK